METLDVVIVIAYLIFMLVLGMYASKKQETMEDFYLGGKGIGTFSMMALWLSSWVGGATLVGTAGNAYDVGISAFWYVGAICFGFGVFGLFFTGLIKEAGDMFNLGSIFSIDPVWPGLLVSILTFIPISIMSEPSEEDVEKARKYLISK